MKKERGITLITIVVVIIILLILAGVAINLVAGEGRNHGQSTELNNSAQHCESQRTSNIKNCRISNRLLQSYLC